MLFNRMHDRIALGIQACGHALPVERRDSFCREAICASLTVAPAGF